MGRSQQQAGTPHARSRNTTPLPAAATSSSAAAASTSAAGGAAASASASAGLPPTERTTTDYLELELELIRHLAHEDLVDPSSAGAAVPDARSLGLILDRLETLAEIVDRRGTGFCDRGMRLLATTRKYRVDEVAREEAAAAAESGARGGAAGSSGAGDGDEGRRSNKKKRKAAEGLGPGDTKTGQLISGLSCSDRLDLCLLEFGATYLCRTIDLEDLCGSKVNEGLPRKAEKIFQGG